MPMRSRPFDRIETVSHCRRVCALVRRTSAVLGLKDDVESALSIAASLHHFCGPDFRRGSLVRIFEELPELSAAKPESNATLSLAERILSGFLSGNPSPSDTVEIAAAVLTACNRFDETVEFAALDGTSVAEAVRELHEEQSGPWMALHRATSPVPFVLTEDHLPILPRAAARLMRTSDETSPAHLESIVASDPVLTGRLLEIANSERFGAPRSISHLIDAAARVGVPLARRILLAGCFDEVFASASLRHIWERSQRIAHRTYALAKVAGLDPDEAYVAGLLHDIGRLVFERADADSRVNVSRWLESGLPLTYAEVLTYSVDHAHVGAELLRSWELPDTIIEAVGNHHQPERSRSPLASLLFLAEQWHAGRFAAEGGPELLLNLRFPCATRLTGVTTKDLDEMDVTHMLAAAC